jgi:putative oxidoreductase
MTTSALTSSRPRGWHWTLWGLQLLLAAFFLMAGSTKAFQPLENLPAMMPWVRDVPGWLVRFIAWSEMAGAFGLILPAATRVVPQLTVVAAIGLSTVMVLAAGFHVMRSEPVVLQLVVAGVAAVVAWGRLNPAPIAPRS